MHYTFRNKVMSLIISADFHREKKHISRHDTTPLGLAPLPQHQGSDAVRTSSKALSLSLVRGFPLATGAPSLFCFHAKQEVFRLWEHATHLYKSSKKKSKPQFRYTLTLPCKTKAVTLLCLGCPSYLFFFLRKGITCSGSTALFFLLLSS